VANRPTTYETRLREEGVRFISTNTFLGRLAFRWDFKIEVINRILHRLRWLYSPVVLAHMLWKQNGWQRASTSVQGWLRASALSLLQGLTVDRYMSAWLSWLHWQKRASVLNQHLSGTRTAIQWAERHHVPTVYTEACLPDERNSALWTGIRSAIGRAQVVTAASPGVRQAMTSFLGIDERRILVIPNTVAFDTRSSIHSRAAQNDPLAILFVGRLDPMKGVDVLLEAAARLKQHVSGWRLTIIGDGQLAAELHHQAQSLELESYVDFCGGIDHNALPQYFENAWILVAPSRYLEGFGMIVAEALSFGLPVVASDLPAFRSLVQAGQNGLLVPVDDSEALAAALARLIQNPFERERMRLAALASTAENLFQPDAVAKQYLAAYQRAIVALAIH
jgi:glycosyltransferase involved in cell wall biosynthesis